MTWRRDLQPTSTNSSLLCPITGALVFIGRIRPPWRTWRGSQRPPGMGVTIYGCGQDEAALFRELAPRFGVVPTVTDAGVSAANWRSHLKIDGSASTQAPITSSILVALRQAGVRYISTRSVGYNHIDVECAESVGISVENVPYYSPDSVADYTLMLMLMAVRHEIADDCSS